MDALTTQNKLCSISVLGIPGNIESWMHHNWAKSHILRHSYFIGGFYDLHYSQDLVKKVSNGCTDGAK